MGSARGRHDRIGQTRRFVCVSAGVPWPTGLGEWSEIVVLVGGIFLGGGVCCCFCALRVVVPDYQCCHNERESAAAVQYN